MMSYTRLLFAIVGVLMLQMVPQEINGLRAAARGADTPIDHAALSLKYIPYALATWPEMAIKLSSKLKSGRSTLLLDDQSNEMQQIRIGLRDTLQKELSENDANNVIEAMFFRIQELNEKQPKDFKKIIDKLEKAVKAESKAESKGKSKEKAGKGIRNDAKKMAINLITSQYGQQEFFDKKESLKRKPEKALKAPIITVTKDTKFYSKQK